MTMKSRGESGFTLIELLIGVMLLGVIIVPLTGAMFQGLTATTDTQRRFSESRSPLFTGAYFASDAESADASGITTGGAPVCGNTGTNVISFSWHTSTTPAHDYSVSYVVVGSGTSQRLARAYCIDSNVHDTGTVAPVLGSAAPTATCSPGCAAASRPRIITLTVSKPNGGTFVLTGTRRPT